MPIKCCKDLEVYNRSFQVAMVIFEKTKIFPAEEKYSLVSQILRSSRSVSANIREGYAKRKYPDVFVRHLNDALGSSEETQTWLDYCESCRYLDQLTCKRLIKEYEEISAMLFVLMKSWQKFEKSNV